MTALKPIENLRVVAVAAERYSLNKLCAHPECSEPATDPHHIFPRSMIGGDSWFVAIENGPTADSLIGADVEPWPHVAGLCRAHHDAVESHDAWIKLEDGEFRWYDRGECQGDTDGDGNCPTCSRGGDLCKPWQLVGPLDPQPARGEKRKKVKRFKGEARRKRRTISVKVPNDIEDGGAVWDETLERVKERLIQDELYSEDDEIPVYEALVAALNDWLNTLPSE